MSKSKIDDARAQKLLEIVRYVLDYHEWCEMPAHTDTRCHKRHNEYCGEVELECVEKHQWDSEIPCDGCKMRKKAELVAKWEANYG
jgi:hypothetical protein